jgi:hypothetical protein
MFKALTDSELFIPACFVSLVLGGAGVVHPTTVHERKLTSLKRSEAFKLYSSTIGIFHPLKWCLHRCKINKYFSQPLAISRDGIFLMKSCRQQMLNKPYAVFKLWQK